MQANNGYEEFWNVFLRGGELVVAPFGIKKLSEPTLIFSEFNKTNIDDLGWWHLSCYYQFYAKTECTLKNKNILITRVESLMGNSDYFFPQYGLTATFGKTATQTFPGLKNLMVKEVSYWSRKVMMDEAWFLRDHQIDPVEAKGLLSYFRLSSGLPDMVNFAQFNRDYSYESSNPRYNKASWTPDFVITQ